MKIAVVGTGYVGLSNAVILAQHHEVVAVDIDATKVEQINRRESPIEDVELEQYLAEKPLNLTATLDAASAYAGADFVVVVLCTTTCIPHASSWGRRPPRARPLLSSCRRVRSTRTCPC